MNNRAHSSAIELQKSRLSPQAAPWPPYIQRVTSQRTDQTDIWRASFWDKDNKRNWQQPSLFRSCYRCSPGKQGLEWTSAVLQQRGQTVRRKAKKQKYFIINNLDVHSETQSESQQLLRRQVDNPQRWEETSVKRRKTPEPGTPLLLQGTTTIPHQQGNKAGQRMTVMKWQNQNSEGG